MKKVIELGNLMPHLARGLRDELWKTAKDEGRDVDDLVVHRVVHSEAVKKENLEPGSRAAIKYVSVRTIDRDGEIIVPQGLKLHEFRKYGHVLWNHNYSLPPIGSDEWIRPDDWGVKAKTLYADTGEGTLANTIWALVQQQHLKASSVGFIPLESYTQGDKRFADLLEKFRSEWPELRKSKTDVRRITTKAILLEHSDVSVPANVDAEIVAVAKSMGADDKMLCELFGECALELKAAIPYKKTPLDDPKAKWDAAREIRAADTATLKIMCAWYDAENPDVKSSYKLPHHRAAAPHKCVWKAVSAAMAALLGARGGVDIPAGDRKAVYNHLAKHYADFDKEPPGLRDYSDGELKTMFPELCEEHEVIELDAGGIEAIRPLAVVERPAIEVVSAGSVAEEVVKELRQEVELKIFGRV